MNACDLCDKTFYTKWNLSRHISTQHSIYKKRLASPIREEFSNLGSQQSRSGSEESDPFGAVPTKRHKLKDLTDDDDASLQSTENESVAEFDFTSSGDESEDVHETDLEDQSACTEDFVGNLDDLDEARRDNYQEGGGSIQGDDYQNDMQEGDYQEQSSEDEEDLESVFYAYWKLDDRGFFLPWVSRADLPAAFEHRKWLAEVSNQTDRMRSRLIQKATHSQLEALREIANNRDRGHTPILPRHVKGFRDGRRLLRTLASYDTDYPELRQALLDAPTPFTSCLLLFARPIHIYGRKTLQDLCRRCPN